MKKIILFFVALIIANGVYAQNEVLKIGQTAPEISLPTLNGNTVTLSSLKGKLVLIDFWATWCAPCVKEQPELKAIYDKHSDKVKAGEFEILGVSLDKSKENWQKNIDRFKINWLQVSDLMFWRSPVAKDYAIEGLPFNVIIDEQGKIIAINLHGAELEDFINNHLHKTE
ncbi:MAG TPA: TlpA disulfide reductase family protein [Flavobacterium sp.]|nr:TlpA disulfide reductase family protein [Flavobacterium sp.]